MLQLTRKRGGAFKKAEADDDDENDDDIVTPLFDCVNVQMSVM